MKRFISLIVLVAAVIMSQPPQAHAYLGICCAKCGGNMPMNIPGGGVPETHEFRFKVQPMYMRMDGLRSGTRHIDGNSLLGMPAMGQFMAVQENMDMYMLNVAMGYSLTNDIFVGVMGMYQVNRMDMRFNGPMQGMTGMTGYTMESDGFADTMLMGKYLLYADDPLIPTNQISLFTGASLPTGSIDQRNTTHPLAMRQTELLPYGMQLGSGTVDPIFGLLYQGSASPLWWGLNAMYTGRWYDNDRDYRLGDKYRVDAYAMYQLRYDLVAEAQLNYEWSGRIRGEADESLSGASGHAVQGNAGSPFMTPLWDPANYGGSNLFVTLGLQWQPLPLHIINVQVGLPLYRDLNGPQLETDWRVSLTWYVEIPTSKSIRHAAHQPGPSKLGF
jgi:hypothetical protein